MRLNQLFFVCEDLTRTALLEIGKKLYLKAYNPHLWRKCLNMEFLKDCGIGQLKTFNVKLLNQMSYFWFKVKEQLFRITFTAGNEDECSNQSIEKTYTGGGESKEGLT